MKEIDFISSLHTSTKRDYVQRVVEHDKAESATVAKQWGKDYWDGDRRYGYGGYTYDGRWRAVADAMANHYDLKAGDRILDVGCGKAFLLYELTQAVPGIEVAGIDVSEYGLEHAKEEVKPFLKLATATDLPFEDNEFDFVYTLNTLHNLQLPNLYKAVGEIERVGKNDKKYILLESYRNEKEKANLLYWQLTCESFYSPEEWVWIYKKNGFHGDYGFIFFE
ncbi:MAG: class I SAM-dependent methyltransferase [Rhodospirillales bacterium]|nr:class I SAM-dependent methyltransferase [Rhodospirillales bacterium]